VVLSFAAREADIVSINNVPFGPTEDGLTPQQEAVRRLDHVRAAAGTRLAGLEIEASPFFTAVSDDAAAAAARIAALVDFPADTLADHPNVLLGPVGQLADRLEERRETYGVNYVTIQQPELERFAPVVARLAGC
jgi:alkanesulfonate monooxygenase SsuD/methylene tetrahydromethanopterin reductase-like flavin-dependent oxidoreductase (luciferase family)